METLVTPWFAKIEVRERSRSEIENPWAASYILISFDTNRHHAASWRYEHFIHPTPLTPMDRKNAELPPPDTKRWVVRRKAAVVAAVRAGVITVQEACRRYQLSEEEFSAWQRAFDVYGLRGLRTTRIQSYRDLSSLRAFKRR